MKFIKTVSKDGFTYVALKSPENTFHWTIYHRAMDLIKMGCRPATHRDAEQIIKLPKP